MNGEKRIRMEIEMPERALPDIRCYIVLYGGCIIKENKSELQQAIDKEIQEWEERMKKKKQS